MELKKTKIIPGVFNANLHPASEGEIVSGRKICRTQELEFDVNGLHFCGTQVPTCYTRMLVIKKKSESKLHFIPVSEVYAFNPQSKASEPETVPATKTPITYSQLTQQFGLRKQQRALNEAIRANYDPELKRETMQLMNEATGQKRKSDGTLLKSSAMVTTSSGIQLPPHDTQTPDVRQAFDVKWFAPSTILQELASEAEQLINATPDEVLSWMSEKKYPRTILTRLNLLPRTEEARLEMAERYLLWHYMWKLSCLNQRQLQRKDPMPGAPSAVVKFLLSRYTESAQALAKGGNQVVMSPLLKNTLIVHHLIFLLSIFDYKIVVTELLEDMATSGDTLKKRAAIFGGTVSSAKDPNDSKRRIYSMQLTAPLNV